MNINWLKIGKVASVALPLVGSVIGAVVGNKERKQETYEATEKLFKEYIQENK